MKNEERAVRLFTGITGVGDDLIEEAGTAQVKTRKKISGWRRWGALAAGLCLIMLAGAGVWRWISSPDTPMATGDLPPAASRAPDTNDTVPDGASCDLLPGGIIPVLRVGDTLYRWAGKSVRLFLDESGCYCSMGNGATYLPEGFHEYGAVSGVTEEAPTEDLQLQAGFEANGTVFVSEEHPAVVYALLHTGRFAEEGSYIRFVSDALGDNDLVSWQGRMYRFSADFTISPILEALPEGCEPIGNLHYVGDDSIPAGDLETNCRGDSYFKPLDGREVYAVPGDDSVLYVFERRYWREGDYPAWRACHLWER